VKPPVDPELVAFATDIAVEAGRYTLRYFQTLEFEIEHKNDGSEVTAIDKGAERMIRERIAAAFPDDTIVGEEEEDHHGTSGRRWIIDPIDGTSTFTHGVPLYCNLVYLEDEHGPAVGVINVPGVSEVCSAGRGLGATLNGHPCRVSDRTEPVGALLTSSGFDHWDPDVLMRLRASGMMMRTWGDGFGYALVASGRAEAMVDPEISPWDIAPCRVIIPEAGGRCTGFDGTDSNEVPDFVASNGHLHDTVLAILGGP